MRKGISAKVSRMLSILLAAGMIVTSVPVDVWAGNSAAMTEAVEDNAAGAFGAEDVITEGASTEDCAIEDGTAKNPSDEDSVLEEREYSGDPEQLEDESSETGLVEGEFTETVLVEDESVTKGLVEDAQDENVVTEGAESTLADGMAVTDNEGSVTADGSSPLTAAYYVTGAAAPVDMNAADGYVPVTGTQNGDRELYSAFYNDMIYERQGGKWYWGHEAVMYGAAGKKVYSDDEKKNETAAPVSFNTDMVFELNYMPVELSDHYRHNLCFSNGSNADWHSLPGVELWAWEYEPYQAADGTTRYRRVKTRQLNASEYEVEYDQDAWFTNYFMQNETEPFNLGSDPNDYYNVEFTAPVFGTKGMLYFDRATLPGSVKLNGSWMKNSSNPVAIVAMIYDATKGTYASVEELARGESSIWENDKYFSMCCLLSDQSSDKYSYSRNFYSDDPYTATALGSFSPKAYDYYKDDASGVITLYSGGNYGGFARGFALGYTDSYRDKTGSDLMIDTWEIPSEWTDDLTGKTYKVRIDNTPIGETDVYRGCLYPCMAETFVIDPGVIMPDDCSYFMLNSVGESRVNFLKNFKINGSPASFGSNIRNLRHFFAKSYSLPDSNYEAIDIRALDTSNVEDMSYMFENVILAGSSTSVNVDVSRFNTSKVKSFEGMFKGYHVTDNGTVRHYYTKVDVSGFDTSNAETMAFMFCDMYMCENTGCGTLDVSNFKFTNKLTDMQGMFAGNPSYETPGLVKIILPADMDTSNVKDMSYLFCADDSLREIVNLSALDTGNVVDISGMFGKYMHDALFGTMSDKKNLPTTYWTSRDTGSWINDRTVASGFENPTFDVRFYGQSGNTGFFGPAIESLDLSNFDTRNVKYAYGAFCWMPNLKEIKWGGNTTFEKVTDANFMFILPALKKMDLTGRKFNSLKYAFRMLMLYSAESLTLGKDSLNLSAIAQDEGFTVSVPRVREVDFRNVKFGDNNKAFSGYSLYDDYWVSHQFVYEAEGLVAATDLKFPAMPEFATAAKLPPVSFKDGNNTEFTTIQGGNTGEISLTSGDDPAKLPVESVGVTAVIDMGTSGDGWMMNNGEKYKLLATIHPLRAVQDVTWTSSDTSIATVDEDGIVTAVGGKYGGAEVTITATSKADSSKSGSFTIKVYLAMLDGDEPAPSPTPSPTPTPTPVPDNMDVTGISLNKSAVSMYPNETFKLSATVSPAGAGNKTVSWSSSDTGVATVDANGNVKAKAAGTDGSAATATITATANGAASGSTVTASCTVTVLPSEIVETGEDDTPIDPGSKAIDETSGEAKVWVAGLNNSGYYYTGNAIKPAIHVYKGHKLLVEKTDYTIAYKNNKNVSSGVTDNKKKPQIIITMKDEYSGKELVYFDIVPMPLDKIEVSDGSLNAVYKAKKKNQLKPVLMYGSEKLKYGNKELVFKWYKADSEGKATDVESTCIEAGTYAVKVFKGSGSNFSDSSNNGRQIATITVTDSRILMSSVKISGFKSNLPYNKGDEVLQAVTLTYKDKSGTYTLKESKTSGDGGDYTVTYSDNREAGTAKVIFEATEGGRFCGRLIKTFKITGKCVLTQGKNGELNTGEAGVILGTGSGQDAFDFTGSNITPVVTVKASIVNNSGVAELVTLKQGTDFTVSYKNNKAVAAADAKNKKNKDIAPQVIIKGKGNYVFGTAKNAGIVKRFAITQADLSSLVLTIADKAYSKKNGDYKKTKIVFCDSDYRDLKLKEGRDYDVGSYITSDSTQAPAAGQTVTVTITGKGSYKGTVKGSYRISDKSYKDISKAKVVVNPNAKGNAQACVYTGSGIEPGQTGQPGLTLTMGSGKKMVTLAPKTVSGGTVTGDYEIIGYYNNVNPGKGAVILIRGIGSYRGIRAVKFTISAAKVSSRWGGVYVQ